MSWGLFSPRHHSREFQTDIDKGHVDLGPFLSACLLTGIGCPEATLPPSEVLISLLSERYYWECDMQGIYIFLIGLVIWKLTKKEKEQRCGAMSTGSCPLASR